MMHLITGGSGSGKSAYAESQVLAAGPGRRIYIATMIPYGEEGRQRVERHRALRREKQFETVECYTGLAELSLKDKITQTTAEGAAFSSSSKDTMVLLECMSNLVANEVFEPDGAQERTVEAVCEGIRRLRRQTRHLFIVTNEIFSDGITYDPETMRYLSYLGAVNQRLAGMADAVTEVVYGIPVRLK
ncbi:MAG: bifunctional adenosylcobinamide kinase/adenosylcobinamide-phosphate guanylyltransferase [Lachnospiraceae bacterium]|nr:bifunctional adenosylcobinamide kinase/adenosylcobinamide-phosphate guanylyltransferase [Lachnospiraceae bacterium]